jgi:pimeloyl-ACP methyl ester carboxylesterase
MIFGAPPIGKPMAADAFLPNPLFPLVFKNALSNEEAVSLTASFFKPGTRIPEFFVEDMRRADGRARETLGVSAGEGNYADEVKVVVELKKPLAIVHGEKDPLANISYIRGLNMPTLWRGSIQIIPDAGHSPHWEQPEMFNSLLAEFVKDCTC